MFHAIKHLALKYNFINSYIYIYDVMLIFSRLLMTDIAISSLINFQLKVFGTCLYLFHFDHEDHYLAQTFAPTRW